MAKLFFMFWSIVMGIVSFIQAGTIQPSGENLINKLYKNEQYCVRNIQGEKIYLKSDKIFTTDEGIFLDLNGFEYCPLPLLQSNEGGCSLEFELIQNSDLQQLAKKDNSKGPCPNCDVPTDKNGRCRNPKCLFEGIRVL